MHGLREYFAEIDALRKMGVNVARRQCEVAPRQRDQGKSDRERELSRLRKDTEADFILYYIRIVYNGRRFYKIGVTTTGVAKRFRGLKIDKILYEARVIGALKFEKEVLMKYREHSFPLGVLKDGNGYTEFFDKDVLGEDRD